MAVSVYSLTESRFDELKRRALQAALDNSARSDLPSDVLIKDAQVIFEWLLDTGKE